MQMQSKIITFFWHGLRSLDFINKKHIYYAVYYMWV